MERAGGERRLQELSAADFPEKAVKLRKARKYQLVSIMAKKLHDICGIPINPFIISGKTD